MDVGGYVRGVFCPYTICACTGWFVSDLFGNHIVGFPTRRLIYFFIDLIKEFCSILLEMLVLTNSADSDFTSFGVQCLPGVFISAIKTQNCLF